MPIGTKFNCSYCPDFKNGNCDGEDKNCLCRECPRNLGQCICVKYCRETESILTFDEEVSEIRAEDPRKMYED
ncbi:hypothetical protein [Clostridium fungisolvens]|uniref:Uncharacterized protein n=1 Tax=Clostridium fungisolvens TaxID=1604897 RepID=A0A6V8SNC2_9CLOT|nr:hypothetical protein [Clostridium fungisolvens]GFP78370.1 hypothetical protein bsdtw1_04592 [Clostridium fungisolvens]